MQNAYLGSDHDADVTDSRGRNRWEARKALDDTQCSYTLWAQKCSVARGLNHSERSKVHMNF